MTRATLLALAERVEAATWADRELDAAIDGRYGYSAGNIKCEHGFLMSYRYTASLDAAMSLVPSGMLWSLEWVGHQTRNRIASCTIWKPHMPTSTAVAATPALALTAASLRAVAGSMTDAG